MTLNWKQAAKHYRRRFIDKVRFLRLKIERQAVETIISSGPITEETEIIFVNGVSFVNANKHQAVCQRHYERAEEAEARAEAAEAELRDALFELEDFEELGNAAFKVCQALGVEWTETNSFPEIALDKIAEWKAENQRLREAMEKLTQAPTKIREIMRQNNLAIDDLDNPMQKLALTIYTELASLAVRAEDILQGEEEDG